MLFQKETGTCTGRGFYNTNNNGYLAKFKNWIAQSYPSGPGWSIIDDQSMDTSYGKWGKISNKTRNIIDGFKAVTDGSFRITINSITADVTSLNFSSVNTWEDIASVIQTGLRAASGDSAFTGAVCSYFKGRLIDSYAVGTLVPKFIIIAGIRGADISYLTSTGSGTDISGYWFLNMYSGSGASIESGTSYPYIVVCSTSSPNWDDNPPNKYLQIGQDNGSGYIYLNYYLHWDTSIHMGFGLWASHQLTTDDSLDFVYDFRGGNEMMIIQSYKLGSWYSSYQDTWVGDSILIDSTSIRGVTVNDVDTTGNVLNLSTGQGSQFTAGSFYYLIDMSRSESVQYMQIAPGGISGDSITFTQNFNMYASAGAVLSPYYHRFYSGSTASQSTYNSRVPYFSQYSKEMGYGDIQSDYGCQGDNLTEYLLRMSPNDKGTFACMKPGITEIGSTYRQANRSYGPGKNMYIVYKGTMNPGTDGKIIQGKNYRFFKSHSNLFTYGNSNLAILYPDFNENT